MVAAQGLEDELRSVQLTRLKQAVSYAYENVPFYREKFAAAVPTPPT